MGLKRTDEFRHDAVRIALTSGLTRKQVADDLGMPIGLRRFSWRNQSGDVGFNQPNLIPICAQRTPDLYLHIAFQPFFINAFAMELVPAPVKARVWRWVMLLCAAATAILLIQLVPLGAFGRCTAGAPLCGPEFCTVSGEWHIAWNIPYNGLFVPFEAATGIASGFPAYMIVAFVLPLAYGAWRFVVFHVLSGPILASALTNNPNEMPAIWCLFSIFILLVGVSVRARQSVTSDRWWGRRVME